MKVHILSINTRVDCELRAEMSTVLWLTDRLLSHSIDA